MTSFKIHTPKQPSKKDRERLGALLEIERSLWATGYVHIAGIDEVGAGPLAGPVVAAAVILPIEADLPGVDDSKALSPARRERMDTAIREVAIAWSLGICSVEEIDTLNVYQASREAMRRALEGLCVVPNYILVDARSVPKCTIPQRPIVKGDATSLSIAAASIVAKVARDAMMCALAQEFPVYGFEQHKGYGTVMHLEALRDHGPCVAHRRSFAPVRMHAQAHVLSP